MFYLSTYSRIHSLRNSVRRSGIFVNLAKIERSLFLQDSHTSVNPILVGRPPNLLILLLSTNLWRLGLSTFLY